LLAIADALPTFPADEFVIAAEPERADALIRRAYDRFALPTFRAGSCSRVRHTARNERGRVGVSTSARLQPLRKEQQ
jgi:hypothetical protein